MDAKYWVILAAAAALFAAVWILLIRKEFWLELRRLNMEIARSEGEEQRAWRALRRRLWLSLLPFVKY